MIGVYVLLTLTILVLNFDKIPDAFALIFTHAFSPISAVGGFAGAAVKEAITKGVSRGVFSNESGLGSSPIAAAAAQTQSPVSQALVSMTQTFIDTLFVCTLTGLALITTGVWNSGETGAALTANAFTEGLGGKYGGQLLAVSLSFFAYSTILGWSYYGEKAVEFLLGERSILPYRILFIGMVGVGAMAKLDLVWVLSDIFNGLMALPNLIGLLFLAPLVREETLRYFQKK
jgi:AGCS family alanine or glycine:cation symporter